MFDRNKLLKTRATYVWYLEWSDQILSAQKVWKILNFMKKQTNRIWCLSKTVTLEHLKSIILKYSCQIYCFAFALVANYGTKKWQDKQCAKIRYNDLFEFLIKWRYKIKKKAWWAGSLGLFYGPWPFLRRNSLSNAVINFRRIIGHGLIHFQCNWKKIQFFLLNEKNKEWKK